MRILSRLITFAALSFIAMASDASANFNPRMLKVHMLPRAATQIAEAGLELAPIAYVKFCLSHGDQCEANGDEQRIALTESAWAKIAAVNAAVNERIRPDANKNAFNWSLDATRGNCNDYAVQKRKALLEQGLPVSALSLAVVLTPWGEGHLVLTVRTDRGDYVLDNLRPNIVAWDHTGYRWQKIQSAADPMTWVAASGSLPSYHSQPHSVLVAFHHRQLIEVAGTPAVSSSHGFIPLQPTDFG